MRWSFLVALVFALGAAGFLVSTEAPVEDPVWWYGNTTPPALALQGPAGPLRGAAVGVLTLQPLDRAHLVKATVDGQPVALDGFKVPIDSSVLPDGEHHVQVTARDTSRRQNESTASWTFVSDNSPPRLSLELSPSEGPVEGHTLEIRVRSSKPATFTAVWEDRPVRLQPVGTDGFWALEGLAPDPGPTEYHLSVEATDTLGNTGAFEGTYPLVRTTFPEDDLQLEGQLAALLTPATLAADAAQLAPVYATPDGPPRWSGPFRAPVQGPITTDFGTHRSYEYHPGTDFALPQGTPVRAPAPGAVAFEGQTPLHGNVLILDHGAGIYTTYAHLQRFSVDTGSTVQAGDTIATVGSTGLSTGPHLHWELWVNGSNVDPIDWTKRAYP